MHFTKYVCPFLCWDISVKKKKKRRGRNRAHACKRNKHSSNKRKACSTSSSGILKFLVFSLGSVILHGRKQVKFVYLETVYLFVYFLMSLKYCNVAPFLCVCFGNVEICPKSLSRESGQSVLVLGAWSPQFLSE